MAVLVCLLPRCRMHSLQESFSEGRVPGGSQFTSVVARLSTVQVVFMNRFLTEFLDYLAGGGGGPRGADGLAGWLDG